MRNKWIKGPDQHCTRQVLGATVIVNFKPYNNVIWSWCLYKSCIYECYLSNRASLNIFGAV
jgi:hypothetical protein